MNRPLTLAVPLALVLAGACHKDDPEEANADEYFYQCGDSKRPAGLTVFATDEVYREFIDRVTASGFMKSDAQAPQLMTPTAGGTLSIAAPPTFGFTAGMVREDAGPHWRVAPGLPARRPAWAWLKEALSFEGTAWAHCPAVTGTIYLLQLTPQGAKEPAYQALASVLSFTPDATTWKSKLAGLSGKKVTLTLARGVFSMGKLQLGPFIADKDVTFTVGP
jgi:hypothetical protein